MKTVIQQMIEEIDNQQKRYIDLAKKDKKLSKGVDAILTATTLLKMKAKELLEAEKEQIIEAYNEGKWAVKCNSDESTEDFYNRTYKSKE